jgi:hypothetical protein
VNAEPVNAFEDTDLPQKCPTCAASLKGAITCRRCKTDLAPLAEIMRHHRRHLHTARRALADGDAERFFLHARRAHSLRQTRESSRLLACAAVLSGRFALAAGLWATNRDAEED